MKVTKIQIDLPLEVGKVYRTKFQTGDLFLVTKIMTRKFMKEDVQYQAEGLYMGKEHIGTCPLPVERLIHDKIDSNDFTVHCSNCDEIMNDVKELILKQKYETFFKIICVRRIRPSALLFSNGVHRVGMVANGKERSSSAHARWKIQHRFFCNHFFSWIRSCVDRFWNDIANAEIRG